MLFWLGRIADPLLHALAHEHHELCVEPGQHMHEGDDSCQWMGSAYLIGVQPSFISWKMLPHSSWRNEHVVRESSAKYPDNEAIALRGPPIG